MKRAASEIAMRSRFTPRGTLAPKAGTVLRSESVVLVAIIALLLLSACGGPTGVERERQIPPAPGSETQVTSAPGRQSRPVASGQRVVWMDTRLERLAGADFFTRTLHDSAARLTTDEANPEGFAAVSGDRVVWSDRRTATEGASNNTDVFLVDALDPGAGERQLTSDTAPQRDPDISGRWVAWTDRRDGNQDIFAYDLEADAEVRITDEVVNQFGPALAGDRLVWLDGRDGGSIRLRNLATGEQRRLVADVDVVGGVDITGDRVVWAEDSEPGGGTTIRLLDIASGDIQTVASGPVRRLNPVVSESLVVWEELIGQDSEATTDQGTTLLLVFDISSGRTMRIPDVVGVPFGLLTPAVSGRRVVWEDLRPNNSGDIFLFEVAR